MVLKCDLHEALIDPLTLQNGELFVSTVLLLITKCCCYRLCSTINAFAIRLYVFLSFSTSCRRLYQAIFLHVYLTVFYSVCIVFHLSPHSAASISGYSNSAKFLLMLLSVCVPFPFCIFYYSSVYLAFFCYVFQCFSVSYPLLLYRTIFLLITISFLNPCIAPN